jgi:hypothetical protein
MTIGEQVLRSAVAAVVTDREGHGSVPTPPSRVGVRLIWCAIHPRCSEEFTAYYTQATQFLHLARWTRLVRSFPDWTRYSTGQATDRRTPLRVLAEHVRDHGPVPTVTVTARPQEEGRLPQWTAACGQIRPGELPGTLVHVVLQPSGPPRTTFQEALMDCQDLARETGAVRMRPQSGLLSQEDAASVLSAIGHPLAEEAAGSAAQFPLEARLGYATDVCKAILQAAELAARARGKQAKHLDDLFRHRRKLCAEALMVACALRSATCSEASVLWDLFTERLRKTRSLTRTLREVFDRTAAVGFVLENMARTT